MFRGIHIAIFFCLLSAPVIGQYKFQYAQYQQSALIYNPAFSGIEDFVDIKVGYRNRWAGLDQSPSSAMFLVNAAVQLHETNKYKRRGVRLVEPEAYQRLESSNEFQYRKSKRQGFGVWIVQNDNVSVSEIGGFLSYAYHLPISDFIVWSLGTSMGAVNGKVDASNLTVFNPDNDQTYQDYLLNGESSTSFVINMGSVIYSKNWYLGYAVNNLVSTNFSAVKVTNPLTEDYEMQHNVMLGFTDKRKYGVLIMPSALIEYAPNAPVSYTFSLRARYEDAIWGGLAYRYGDAVNLSVGLYLTNNIALNYAFEYSLSEISGLNTSATHELILAFKLNNKNFSRAYMW
jgi:type IX secretion system PorP/SprF family membrane protein